MAKATPLTEADRARIAELHAEGLGCNAIARELGRSPATVSRASRDMGLMFDRAQVREATQAKQDVAKARRAKLSLDLLDDAARLRARLWEPTVVVISTPKGPARVELDLPPARDARDLMGAVQSAVRSHADLERLDSGAGADAAKSMLGQLAEGLKIAADQLNGTTSEEGG